MHGVLTSHRLHDNYVSARDKVDAFEALPVSERDEEAFEEARHELWAALDDIYKHLKPLRYRTRH